MQLLIKSSEKKIRILKRSLGGWRRSLAVQSVIGNNLKARRIHFMVLKTNQISIVLRIIENKILKKRKQKGKIT